ncbi:hypothetical protein [Curtobacterium sp. MCLR17_054]|uniref:hypothetical protein n=1 Tax=Curtobacterium sp. MCLR17_054 TaxID=2175632 RepID=UPI000DA8D070|nr:hypothetical protein [Curtobacterium sp. MCLR17_054]WIE69204.1 hypothetical protein DEJ08_004300 [Curtobacterium sp. MCLR17_054]
MSFDALNAQIEGLREQATQLQRSTNQERKNIAADTALSEEGKRQQAEAATAYARTQVAVLRNKETQLVKDSIRTLETQLDAKVGSGATDMIAFRDAQERADRVEDKEGASRLMSLALRSNDHTLAHALFRKAIDQRWGGVVDGFAAERPDSATAAKEIQILDDYLKNTWQRNMAYMV